MERFCELCGGYGHSRSAYVTRRTWWDRLRGALICVLLTALVVIAIQAVLLLRAVTETARVTTQTVGAIPIVLTQQLTLTRLNAVAEIDLTRADAMTAIGQGLSVADSRIGDSLSRVDAALAVLGGVRSDLKPTLDASAALLKDGKDSLDDLYPDVKASTESATVAVTSFARTSQSISDASQSISDATPKLVARVDDIGKHIDATAEASQKASEKTAEIMANFAKATKPLPRVLRVGLQVAGPVAMSAYYLSMMLLAIGVI